MNVIVKLLVRYYHKKEPWEFRLYVVLQESATNRMEKRYCRIKKILALVITKLQQSDGKKDIVG
jgi:hypothetical protein